jgi:uncharacterized protein with FMN-binding domain
MTRAPIVLTATAAGLAATLGFHAHAPAARPAKIAASPSTRSAGAATTPSTTAAPPASTATQTVTSDAISNQYGNVQLKVTVSGGKITGVEALQLPNGDPKSAEINAYAGPALRQSALTAQSANIDVVSGATYTSDSYATALQNALDQAGSASGNAATS